jgi:hypothetical protein
MIDTHLLGARVKDVELQLGQAAILRVSRAIEQTFFISVTCIYCLYKLYKSLSKKWKLES